MRVTKNEWRWVVLIAATLGPMLADGIVNNAGVFIVPWRNEFNWSMTEVSTILSVNLIAFYSAGGFCSRVIQLLGFRTAVMTGGAFSALGILLSSLVSTKWLLCLTLGAMSGFFSGVTYSPFKVALASYFHKNYTIMTGISATGVGISIIAFPPMFQFLIDAYTWRGCLLLYSALVANVVVFGMLLRPDTAWGKRRPWRKVPSQSGSLDAVDDSDETGSSASTDAVSSGVEPVTDSFPVVPTEDDERLEFVKDYGKAHHTSVVLEESTTGTDVVVEFAQLNEDVDRSSINRPMNQERSSTEKSVPITDDEHKKDIECRVYSNRYDDSAIVRIISLRQKTASQAGCRRRLSRLGWLPVLATSYRTSLLLAIRFTIGICYSVSLGHLISSSIYRGVSPDRAALLMSFLGIGSVVGRLSNGVVVDTGLVTASRLFSICVVVCGSGVVMWRLVGVYWLYSASTFSIGAASGAIFNLEVVLIREFVGTPHMTTVLGMNQLSAGIGSLIGPILGGWLYDVTNNYDYTFYIFGGLTVVAGLLSIMLEPTLRSIEEERAKRFLENLEQPDKQCGDTMCNTVQKGDQST